MIDLSAEEIDLLQTSLAYSKRAVSDADSPEAYKKPQLARIESLNSKLAAAKKHLAGLPT